ncbi:SphA family protein [Methylocella tundrae]|uniref:Transporter n=1 Tax=Methylocella tundrae TaxID=227605 RepID=A0A4U8Z731_METTU|nr:transporter [Methylocella tundrae]WPP02933.1 transporter [Methylocella tundrae]VFU16594.1 conserved exported protein of unknown function [Methylocella tundrae]
MIKKLLISATLLVASVLAANAGESIIPITPPGGTDLSQALLPPTGLYFGLVTIPFNRNDYLFGINGKPVPSAQNLKISAPINAGVLSYVYPFDVFGGSLKTSVVLPVEHLCFDIIAVAEKGCVAGLADTYSDLFYWSKSLGLAGVTPGKLPLQYGLTFAGGMAIKAPTGAYTPSSPLNVGSGSWVAIPNFALTYTTGPNWSIGGDSTEVSARLFYGVPFTNPRRLGSNLPGYTSGNLINVDWSVSERYGPFRLGVAGAYETQVSNDTTVGGIPKPHGNRFNLFEIGPVAEYMLPGGVVLKAKYLRVVAAQNNANEQFFYLSLGMKIF